MLVIPIRQSAAIAVLFGICLSNFAVGLFLGQKEKPKGDADKFMLDTTAKAYQKMWSEKDWQTTRLNKLCDDKKLPNATHELVDRVCGGSADRNRCVCNLAKAHSCHVGCAADHFAHCPKECGSKYCAPGDPENGGVPLSGGYTGTCYNYCSMSFGESRFCGAGTDYQSHLYVDCTGCDPASKKEAATPDGKKDMWTSCMANCFPSPTCAEMCAEGGPECFSTCVERYKSVVEPYFSVFKDSSTNVLDLFPGFGKNKEKADETVGGGAVEKEVKSIKFSIAKAGDGKGQVEAAEDDGYEHVDDDFKDGSHDLMLRKARHTNTMRQARSLGLAY